MNMLISAVLGLIVLATIAVNVQHRMLQDLTNTIYKARVMQAASQEASFARSVAAYVAINSVSSGTILTPLEMMTAPAPTLAPGYPATNPFGQTPEAIVGSNNVVLITYTAPPTELYLAPYDMNVKSSIDLQSISLEEASDIAAMQAGIPQLSGGMLSAGTLSTPMQTFSVASATYFPGVSLPAGPIFADMLYVQPVPVFSNPTAAYGATMGD
jgi:hypothetical protein